jgi:hypothetical protein
MNTYIGRKGASSGGGGGGFLANPYPSSNPARPRGDAALDKNAHTSFTEKENPIQTTNHTSRLNEDCKPKKFVPQARNYNCKLNQKPAIFLYCYWEKKAADCSL